MPNNHYWCALGQGLNAQPGPASTVLWSPVVSTYPGLKSSLASETGEVVQMDKGKSIGELTLDVRKAARLGTHPGTDVLQTLSMKIERRLRAGMCPVLCLVLIMTSTYGKLIDSNTEY